MTGGLLKRVQLLVAAVGLHLQSHSLNISINVAGEALQSNFVVPTLEAATSCAVLAAISWEEAMSSSY